MSRNEKVTLKIKYSKIKSFEKICYLFSQDYTAIEASKALGLSRQTINHYYKILRDRLNKEFISFDLCFFDKLLQENKIHIKYLNIYKKDIFYLNIEGKVLLFDEYIPLGDKINQFAQNSLKQTLCKHKRANCARVLLDMQKQSFLVLGYLKQEDNFEYFLQNRLKQFRGISKQKLFFYIKESQIRYNISADLIYQKLLFSFK